MKNILFTLAASATILSCATNTKNNEMINLDEIQNQKSFNLKTGEELVFQLTTNPTTGYDWETTLPDDCSVEIVDESTKSENKTNQVGAPSIKTYKIKGLNAGECSIRFDYKRNWEDTIDKTKEIKFIVK